jgi:hypothetical protein
MTTGVVTVDKATRGPQLGSFTIVERLNVPDAPKGQVLLRVLGTEGTPFSGQAGLATCYSAPKEETARASAKAVLDKLAALRHPSLVPILQTGLAGNVVYWIWADSDAQHIPALSPEQPVPISTVVTIVKTVASGLAAAHQAGLSHGSLAHHSILSPAPGTYLVEGVGATGRGGAQDQRDLGMIVIGLLSGRQWQEEELVGPASIEQRVARAQRLREWMSGTTERVVNVVLRATELNPVDRFDNIQEFAEQFGIAVRDSAEDLVHGAFEAISSRNVELARLLAAKAAHYNPEAEGLTLLNMQLNGGSPFGAMPVLPPMPPVVAPIQPGFPTPEPIQPAQTLPPIPAAGQTQVLIAPELTQGLPPEFIQLIAPQFEVATRKKGMNPLFVLAIGGAGGLLMLLIAAMVTFIVS